jgi:hypothetical protein
MTESTASRELREAGQRARRDACWADPLTRAERRILREKLSRACKRLHGVRAPDGLYSPAHVSASAEMADLHLDVTERAEVPAA